MYAGASSGVPDQPSPVPTAEFADEAACREYLEACRWPDGFRCPRCGHDRAFPLRAWRRRECAKCRYQVSVTAGTVFHRTRIPLTLWFCGLAVAAEPKAQKRGLNGISRVNGTRAATTAHAGGPPTALPVKRAS